MGFYYSSAQNSAQKGFPSYSEFKVLTMAHKGLYNLALCMYALFDFSDISLLISLFQPNHTTDNPASGSYGELASLCTECSSFSYAHSSFPHLLQAFTQKSASQGKPSSSHPTFRCSLSPFPAFSFP